MDRFDFYFEQLVTQADVDEAFDFAEAADRALAEDHGWTGVVNGLSVNEDGTPDLTVTVSAGVAYDFDGQRCFTSSPQTVNLAVDSNSVATAVSVPGNAKWLSLFIAFDRALSEPRLDGNGNPLQYRRAESYRFIVDQAAESAEGTAAGVVSGVSEPFALSDGMTLLVSVNGRPPQTATFNTGDFVDIAAASSAEVAAVLTADIEGIEGGVGELDTVELVTTHTGAGASVVVLGGSANAVFAFSSTLAVGAGGPSKPALRADAVLLADVLLRHSTSAVFDFPDQGAPAGFIDMDTRRQLVFSYAGAFNIKSGTIGDFAEGLANLLAAHIQNPLAHLASAITYAPSGALSSGDVQAALDELEAEKGGLAVANTWTSNNVFDGTLTANGNATFAGGYAWRTSGQPFTAPVSVGTQGVSRSHFQRQSQVVYGAPSVTEELVALHVISNGGVAVANVSQVFMIEGMLSVWEDDDYNTHKVYWFTIGGSADGSNLPSPAGVAAMDANATPMNGSSPAPVSSLAVNVDTGNPVAGSTTIRLTAEITGACTLNMSCFWTVTTARLDQ